MLILKTLSRGPMHGYGISQSIQQISDDVLRVEEGSLYPALHRLELDGRIDSEWGLPRTTAAPSSTSSPPKAENSCPANPRMEAPRRQAIARVMETAA